MKKQKIKNPLRRRIPRELRGDWKKYLVVSLFLILTIGFVSGMYVANESMMTAADKGVIKYKLEDGHFELESKADAKEKYELNDSDFQPVPVTVYENFYRNEDEDNNNDGETDGTVRVYAKTEDINLACVLDGRLPEAENEIAIDRMHADNVGVQIGDTITVGKKEWEVVGLIAYVNYSTLHEKNTDFMFDALKFNVAMVTDDGFAELEKPIHYAYAWRYNHAPADEKEEKKLSDDFLKALLTQTVASGNEIKDYLPAYANQAIHFATDDMGSDEAMGGVLLDILIVIIAFIFAVTISNTIMKESKTIGTLRASGYTRGELTRHYLAMPVIVTFFAAAVGNLLGYTVFKNVVVSMYYNSYSLPAYETVWNPTAFLKTTIIPLLLMFVVNLAVIFAKMRHTPLQFLRQDLKKNNRKKAIRLPHWKFFSRFRLRIIFQNMPNYLILFSGIFFVCVMLSMAIGMPDTLEYYKDNAKDMMFAKYQYVLKSYEGNDGKPVTTAAENAEIFAMKSLQKKSDSFAEEISVYGIADDSRYVKIDGLEDSGQNEVYISNSFAEKYGISAGDTVSLEEKYENKKYDFKVAGLYDKSLNIAVFMPIKQFRTAFDLKEDEFTGYLSGAKITDISEDNIATVITERDITKMCDQLDHSMGSYMQYFQVLCILLSAVMIYLLTKIIIEKNENAISMAKILGYENSEIARLYLLSTSIVFIVADLLGIFLGSFVMSEAWKMIMTDYSGWFTFVMNPWGYAKMFLFVLIGYLFVLGFDFRRIEKIPLDKALKNAE
ncbi:MAG: FtsX-like permease family protein [Eubacteriales bacterium]|nr:FtsX-like permease family protein [Eubacteriales bacterium]